MQTSKSKGSSIEILSRSSPKTPKTARQGKTSGSGSEQVLSSPNKANRVNKERSPKGSERRILQSPISEKKRETKASNLEFKIVQLEEDLKQARDKMVSSELLKEQAEIEAEDVKKQLSDMSSKLEDAEKQLLEISGKDKSPVQNLCKTSQDCNTRSESELEVVHKLRTEHEKAVAMVEKLEVALSECERTKAELLEELNNTRSELEAAKEENNISKLHDHNAFEDNRSMASELEESKRKVNELEMLVSKFQSNLDVKNELSTDDSQHCQEKGQGNVMELLKTELEIRVTALEDTLLKKDMLLEEIENENKNLKQRLMELVDGSAADNLVEARAAEQKAINKFEYLTEESDKNNKRTARVIEQLNAAQVAITELESELRKLKVQSDQWRKAAEAAAAMLTSGNNGKYIDRTGSVESGYHTLGGRISSPFSDDLNDETVKKKNGNMLKKIGVLWKKGQNQK